MSRLDIRTYSSEYSGINDKTNGLVPPQLRLANNISIFDSVDSLAIAAVPYSVASSLPSWCIASSNFPFHLLQM